MNHIQLECSSILQVPLQSYYSDFTFIVNGNEFKTSRLISDLLSPKISQIHSNDPTANTFTINTEEQGDFSHILQLVNFKSNEISNDEIPFVTHVLEILCNDTIKIQERQFIELTKDNIINEIHKHESHYKYFPERYSEEIEFISTNFYELLTTKEEELMNLKIETIEKVLTNDHLTIETEDALLLFVNKLYKRDPSFSFLYEYVYFVNVSSEAIKEFTHNFDANNITGGAWMRLCERLEAEDLKDQKVNQREGRYKKPMARGMTFQPSESDPFSGIINYFRENGNIDNDVQVTASSIGTSSEHYQPRTVLMKENSQYYFYTDNTPNSWLAIDFKDHRIIPTAYTIRSSIENGHHPKSWVIQVSNNNDSWSTIDTVNDCQDLNGKRLVHTFRIHEEQTSEFRYFRIFQKGPTLNNNNHLLFETIEIYGTLI